MINQDKTSLVRAGLVAGLAVISSSLAATAQICPDPPEFGVEGQVCSSDRQEKPCACSETLTWDAIASADWYEVHRCDVETGHCLIVGDTRWRNREVTLGPGGSYHADIRPTMWLPAWDQPFPEPQRVYEYTVKACDVRGDIERPICSA